MDVDPRFWSGRRVFLTGHTGFKGAWLALWLERLGALTSGYALAPPTSPSLFDVAGVAGSLEVDGRGDVRDAASVRAALLAARPEIVVHMAAQPLVRLGYRTPVETYAVNVMGTAHVLDAARACPSIRAVIVITSDKCYENREWVHPYREADPLGGVDPYSSSKACTEILTASWRASFVGPARIASARAGNVVGGGDWAADRLVPDCVRAFVAGNAVVLRRPRAIRPWQHVLEPLAGYLTLAQRLVDAPDGGFDMAWNFGPAGGGERSVEEVATALAEVWAHDARIEVATEDDGAHEAGVLRLDSTRARVELDWRPAWSFAATMAQTAQWYRAWRDGLDMRAFSLAQIAAYEEAAR